MQIPDTAPGPYAAEKQDGRTIIPRGRLWLVLCLGILILAQFWPVLAAPVQGDDRYWYAESAGITRGSYGHILSRTAKDVPYFLDRGRFAPVAFGARRMIALATVQLAVASSVPIVAIQALFKLLFGAAAALAVYAFISTARFRGSSRTISNLSPSSIRWVMIGFVGLLVSGAQAHFPFRNGWLAYFPLTYGAVVAIFGSLAFAQWCVKALDNPTRSLRASAYCGMILLAVLLNSTYELYYPAAVLAPIAILRQPTRLDITHERRAKLSLTATFLIPFTVVFSILRLLIRRTCAQSECYEGVIPELGPQVLSVAWRNLTSAIPGFGEAQLRSELAQVGIPWPDAFLIDFAWIGCLVGISIALAWRHQWQALGTAALDAEEAGALWQLAGIAAVAGIGPAVVMSLSKASHQAISDFGLPYRNVVVTWAALSLCTMLAIRAISVGRGHRWKTIVSIILAVAIGFLAAYTFPRNLAAIRANRMLPAVQSIEGIHWELVLGDTSEEADRRRCDLYADAEERIFTSWIQTRMKTGVQSSFEYFHKAPFCSRWDATS